MTHKLLIEEARIYHRTSTGDKVQINNVVDEILEKPFFLIDTYSFNEGRQRTIHNKHEAYYTIEPIDRELRFTKWNTMSIKEKRCYIRSMRRLTNSLKRWKDGGLDIKLFSEVSSTRLPKGTSRVAKTKTEIVTKIATVRHRYGDKKILEYARLDLEDFDATKVAYVAIGKEEFKTPYSSKVLNLHNSAMWLKRKGIIVHFLTIEREKFVKGKVQSIDKVIASLDITDIQAVCDKAYIDQNKNYYSDLSTYSKLTFGVNGFQSAIDLVSKITQQQYTSVPSEILKGISVSQTVKDAVNEINAIDKRYPLLKRADGYYMDKGDTQAWNEYIAMCDLTNP